MSAEWPSPDVRDARLAAHQCVWCGCRLADDCASDDFCGDADMRGWLGSRNEDSGGIYADHLPAVLTWASNPPGSVPDDLLSEPWYVPWQPLPTVLDLPNRR